MQSVPNVDSIARPPVFVTLPMKPYALLFVWQLAFAAPAPAAVPPIVSPAELGALLDSSSVTVIDIRPGNDFAQGHIPGAHSAPYDSWRGPAHSPGTLPPLDTLTEQLRQLGLAPERHAVVVSSGANVSDFGAAARVYWTLKYLGLTQLSILNGGMHAWLQAQQALTQEASALPAPSQYQPRVNNAILATRADVLASIDNPRIKLIDARPKRFYEGATKAPTAAVPGTIRGALNIEHNVWFEAGSTQIVAAERARAIAAERFPDVLDDSIAFCNTGHWAATDWFALSELVGLPNLRMYPESLADWTHADPALPMDHTPGRTRQIADKFKTLFGKPS